MTQILEFAVLVIIISASGVMSPGPLFTANISYGLRDGKNQALKWQLVTQLSNFL